MQWEVIDKQNDIFVPPAIKIGHTIARLRQEENLLDMRKFWKFVVERQLSWNVLKFVEKENA